MPATDEKSDNNITCSDLFETLASLPVRVLSIAVEVVVTMPRLLRIPMSIALTVFIVYQIIGAVTNTVAKSVHASLSPLCLIPGASLFNLSICKSSSPLPVLEKLKLGSVPPPVDFGQLITIESPIEGLLHAGIQHMPLSQYLIQGEMRVRQLRTRVRVSSFKNRGELLDILEAFIGKTHETVDTVLLFNSRLRGLLDLIAIQTNSTIRRLEWMAEKDFIEPPGALSRSMQWLVPGYIDLWTYRMREMTNAFTYHKRFVLDRLEKIISSGEYILNGLDSLDYLLNELHKRLLPADAGDRTYSAENLSIMWSILCTWGRREEGGIWTGLSAEDKEKLSHLTEFDKHRRATRSHVGNSTLTLRTMAAALKHLSENIDDSRLIDASARPSPSSALSLSAHIQILRKGAETLTKLHRINADRHRLEYKRVIEDPSNWMQP
ncbi:hypothetical protein L228DRAFT_266616 [Xylona heveae TC161]|uniref:Uncharacterized protein n=1 Tax=Xylona heveae (strain CBS 132557 / TC161) TaxID=1328760 RepID=A0A165I2E1_XYLHT|nr:hypothetical protein L228DRAFT_266616 [Xylona heveae TC161]KZF24269.1 hypothetical protein L228DRAFT_266616 [Xylona heveae TC161]